jgi:preprotein translocase subunit SecG
LSHILAFQGQIGIFVKKRGIALAQALSAYRSYFEIVQTIISVALIVFILMQVQGAGLGSVFGGSGSVFKTRRGIERLLFNITIIFAVLFAVISLVAAAIPVPATTSVAVP